jgi:hypothetical protein
MSRRSLQTIDNSDCYVEIKLRDLPGSEIRAADHAEFESRHDRVPAERIIGKTDGIPFVRAEARSTLPNGCLPEQRVVLLRANFSSSHRHK